MCSSPFPAQIPKEMWPLCKTENTPNRRDVHETLLAEQERDAADKHCPLPAGWVAEYDAEGRYRYRRPDGKSGVLIAGCWKPAPVHWMKPPPPPPL